MNNVANKIIEEINYYLESLKEEYKEQDFKFKTINDSNSTITVYGYHINPNDCDKVTEFVMLEFCIIKQPSQVQIGIILLPDFMKHKNIGKTMISKIFIISKKEQHDLFIFDMTNSFYDKMIKRYALPCDGCDDAVKIIDKTNLS